MAARVPRLLREQFILYERAGFTVKSVVRASRHYRVEFNEFPETQFLTANQTDSRSYKNNVARFKRLASANQEKPHDSSNVDR
jgi:hypothetical protein